jgi:hypothetical protein
MEILGHQQVLVKVNAEVDAGVAEIVSLLNEFEGLLTVESCQGEQGRRPAFVYFWYGDWRKTAKFLFEDLEPLLSNEGNCEHSVSLEVFNGSRPTGKLQFSPEAAGLVASVLKQVIRSRQNYACSCDTLHTELRS